MTLKRTFAAALLGLGAVILGATGAWLFVDDATLVPLLVKRVEALSDTRISYQDDAGISRGLAPELRVNKLVVDDAKGRYRVETSSLRLQILLSELLFGRLDVPHLLIGDTRVNLLQDAVPDQPAVGEAKGAPPDFSAWRLKPVLHDAQISSLEIAVEGDKFRLPESRVSELSLGLEAGSGVPELSAQVDLEGERLSIAARLPNLEQAWQGRRIPFTILVKSALADVSAAGEVDLSQPAAAVNAELRGHFPDLGRIRGTGDIDIPGSLAVTAKLSGPFGQLALEDLSANWTGPDRSGLKLQGRVAKVIDLEGVDLGLSGRLSDAAWLTPLLPTAMGALDSAEVAARISGDQSRLGLDDFSLKVETRDKLDLTLAGRLDLTHLLRSPEAENLDLKLAFAAPTTRAARVMIFDDVPEFGAITASVDVRSVSGDTAFENLVVETQDGKGIRVDLRGRIAQFPLNPDKPNRGYDLQFTLKAAKTSLVAQRAGMDLPLSGPLDLSCRLQGDTQALQFNDVKLSAGDKRTTLIGAAGQIHFGNWDQADPLQAIDLMLDIRGRDTGFLSAWIKQALPALAYHAQARLHTVSGRHRIDDYKLVTDKGQPLDLWQKGSAGEVSFLPELSIRGIRLDARARSGDVARLNKLFKLDQTIPAIGPLDMRVLIDGTDKKLLIGDLSLSAGEEDVLLVQAKGRVGYLSAEKNWILTDTDLALEARSTSSQALAEAFGYRIPQLGPVSAQADIKDRDTTLGVEIVRLVVGDADQPALMATGSIGDVYKASKVRVDAKLNLDSDDLARYAVDKDLPDLGALTGTLVISDSDGSLGMDSLELRNSKRDVLSLNLDSRFDDFRKPETLQLNGRLKARDANPLAALFGWEWLGRESVEIDTQIKRTGNGSLLHATAISGKEKLDMDLRVNFRTSPPRIEGRITAQNFFLPDPAKRQSEKLARARDQKKKSKQKEPIFSTEPMDLGWMKKADVDLSVDIQSFDRAHSEALSAKFGIGLKAGHLLVKPAIVVYPKGHADLELELDARSQPKFSFSFSGEKLDPWRGLNLYDPKSQSQFEAEDAELNLDISLASSGNSRHEMASNANGQFHVTMNHGKINQNELDLLFADIVGWVSNKAKQRYEDVNCAIADYSIRQGLVTTNAFFIDLDTITIAGEGGIDLGEEQIDYIFIPKKKSRLIARADPVRITGSLNDPSIKAIPFKSAAIALGELVFAPYVFAGTFVAEYAKGRLSQGHADSSVCANYARDLEQARAKQGGKKEAENQHHEIIKRVMRFGEDEE